MEKSVFCLFTYNLCCLHSSIVGSLIELNMKPVYLLFWSFCLKWITSKKPKYDKIFSLVFNYKSII